ncbi:hypothetical protein D3C84_308500 [compost metagenome]
MRILVLGMADVVRLNPLSFDEVVKRDAEMPGEVDWSPLVLSLAAINWTAVLVGLFTAVASWFGPVRLWKKQAERESESVRASLFAEVAALVEIVERRGYLQSMRGIETMLRARQAASIYSAFQNGQGAESFEVLIDSEYSRVYQGNVSKLGVLRAEDAKQIVRFHQLADAVRLDVIPGGGIARGTCNPEDFKEVADLLEIALEIGRALTATKPEPLSKWWQFWRAKK